MNGLQLPRGLKGNARRLRYAALCSFPGSLK